jgi:hypothetical protein
MSELEQSLQEEESFCVERRGQFETGRTPRCWLFLMIWISEMKPCSKQIFAPSFNCHCKSMANFAETWSTGSMWHVEYMNCWYFRNSLWGFRVRSLRLISERIAARYG